MSDDKSNKANENSGQKFDDAVDKIIQEDGDRGILQGPSTPKEKNRKKAMEGIGEELKKFLERFDKEVKKDINR